VAEVADAESPECVSGGPGEFRGVIAGDGAGHEAGGNEVVEEWAMVAGSSFWEPPFKFGASGRGGFGAVSRQPISAAGPACGTQPRSDVGEGARASAKGEFAPVEWPVVVHRHFG